MRVLLVLGVTLVPLRVFAEGASLEDQPKVLLERKTDAGDTTRCSIGPILPVSTPAPFVMPPRPTVELETPKVSGQLDADVVKRLVNRHRNEALYCYELQLAKNPKLAGRLLLEFVIAPDGAASPSATFESALDQETNACIARRVRRWRFPEPGDAKPVTVQIGLTFKAPAK